MEKPKEVLPNQIWRFFNTDRNSEYIHTITKLDPDGMRCYSALSTAYHNSGYLDTTELLTSDAWTYLGQYIATQQGRDGVDCSKCNNFVPMAQPNNPDGSFTCCGCRIGF